MDIIKRNGGTEAYERAKIARVIERAFASVESSLPADQLTTMVDTIEAAHTQPAYGMFPRSGGNG